VRVALAIVVVYFGIGGLLARIEPEELPAAIAADVLVGISIVALCALNLRIRLVGLSGFKRLIPALLLGLACSAMLTGWHCLTIHLRHQAVELHRQWQDEHSPAPDVVK